MGGAYDEDPPFSDAHNGHYYTWTYPSSYLLIPPIILTLQSTLLFLPKSHFLNHLRLSLLPLCLIAIYYSCSSIDKSFFHPVKDFVHFNTVIQLSKFWACIRSIEFAIADSDEYEWIGYERAYAERGDISKETDRKDDNDDGQKQKKKTQANGRENVSELKIDGVETLKDTRHPVLLGWLNLCSLRGIGWQWGIKGSQIASPHPSDSSLHFLMSLLFRIFWSHFLTILAISTITYHRQHSSFHNELLDIYLPSTLLPSSKDDVLVGMASRFIQVVLFGSIIYTSLECGYSLLTLLTYTLTLITRYIVSYLEDIIPVLKVIKPDKFRTEAWPRLSYKPIYSDSLSDFWGKRWHALFRRIFIVVGARPLSNLPERMTGIKVGKNVKTALGALGAFMTSGILHECFNDATPWQARDPYYTVFTFFTVQSFGIMLEKAILPLCKKSPKLSKIVGRVYCWTFLLCTGLLMTECWVDRGIVDNQPPLQEWKWWRWSLPLCFIVPDLSTTRLHQMKHLQQ